MLLGDRCGVGHRDIPANEPHQQDCRRGEQHQWESFDQGVAAGDQSVLEALERPAVKHVVGERDSREKQQWGLDHGSEKRGLPHSYRRGDATHREAARENRAEFLVAGACLDCEAEQGAGDRDHHCGPSRHTGDARYSGSSIGRDRQSGLLRWHP
jgi:hypothetical protein